jgi:DNA-binding GntR family transcriptional regulator
MTMEIDMLSPVPRYRQVAAIVLEEIRAGRWEPMTPAPSRSALASRFGVDAKTIGRAHGRLAALGYLAPVPGIGMVVRPREQWRN